MSKGKRPRSSFSVTMVFASFFGTAMIAIAFAYFNYKFSEYKFIDFKKWILYEKRAIFTPDKPYYTMLIYNSKTQNPKVILDKNQTYPVIAIDFAQEKFPNEGNFTYLRATSNDLLNIIQRFNVYKLPSVLIIKQFKESLYKQDSKIWVLDTNN